MKSAKRDGNAADPSFTNVRVPDGNAYHVYAGIVLSVFRNCAANDGSCPEAQSIIPSVRAIGVVL